MIPQDSCFAQDFIKNTTENNVDFGSHRETTDRVVETEMASFSPEIHCKSTPSTPPSFSCQPKTPPQISNTLFSFVADSDALKQSPFSIAASLAQTKLEESSPSFLHYERQHFVPQVNMVMAPSYPVINNNNNLQTGQNPIFAVEKPPVKTHLKIPKLPGTVKLNTRHISYTGRWDSPNIPEADENVLIDETVPHKATETDLPKEQYQTSDICKAKSPHECSALAFLVEFQKSFSPMFIGTQPLDCESLCKDIQMGCPSHTVTEEGSIDLTENSSDIELVDDGNGNNDNSEQESAEEYQYGPSKIRNYDVSKLGTIPSSVNGFVTRLMSIMLNSAVPMDPPELSHYVPKVELGVKIAKSQKELIESSRYRKKYSDRIRQLRRIIYKTEHNLPSFPSLITNYQYSLDGTKPNKSGYEDSILHLINPQAMCGISHLGWKARLILLRYFVHFCLSNSTQIYDLCSIARKTWGEDTSPTFHLSSSIYGFAERNERYRYQAPGELAKENSPLYIANKVLGLGLPKPIEQAGSEEKPSEEANTNKQEPDFENCGWDSVPYTYLTQSLRMPNAIGRDPLSGAVFWFVQSEDFNKSMETTPLTESNKLPEQSGDDTQINLKELKRGYGQFCLYREENPNVERKDEGPLQPSEWKLIAQNVQELEEFIKQYDPITKGPHVDQQLKIEFNSLNQRRRIQSVYHFCNIVKCMLPHLKQGELYREKLREKEAAKEKLLEANRRAEVERALRSKRRSTVSTDDQSFFSFKEYFSLSESEDEEELTGSTRRRSVRLIANKINERDQKNRRRPRHKRALRDSSIRYDDDTPTKINNNSINDDTLFVEPKEEEENFLSGLSSSESEPEIHHRPFLAKTVFSPLEEEDGLDELGRHNDKQADESEYSGEDYCDFDEDEIQEKEWNSKHNSNNKMQENKFPRDSFNSNKLKMDSNDNNSKPTNNTDDQLEELVQAYIENGANNYNTSTSITSPPQNLYHDDKNSDSEDNNNDSVNNSKKLKSDDSNNNDDDDDIVFLDEHYDENNVPPPESGHDLEGETNMLVNTPTNTNTTNTSDTGKRLLRSRKTPNKVTPTTITTTNIETPTRNSQRKTNNNNKTKKDLLKGSPSIKGKSTKKSKPNLQRLSASSSASSPSSPLAKRSANNGVVGKCTSTTFPSSPISNNNDKNVRQTRSSKLFITNDESDDDDIVIISDNNSNNNNDNHDNDNHDNDEKEIILKTKKNQPPIKNPKKRKSFPSSSKTSLDKKTRTNNENQNQPPTKQRHFTNSNRLTRSSRNKLDESKLVEKVVEEKEEEEDDDIVLIS